MISTVAPAERTAAIKKKNSATEPDRMATLYDAGRPEEFAPLGLRSKSEHCATT